MEIKIGEIVRYKPLSVSKNTRQGVIVNIRGDIVEIAERFGRHYDVSKDQVMEIVEFNEGDKVSYESYPDNFEYGRVVSKNSKYIFVLYDGEYKPKATNPVDLTRI